MSGPGLDVPLNDPRMPTLRRVRPAAFLLLCLGIVDLLFAGGVLILKANNISLLPLPEGMDPQSVPPPDLWTYAYATVGVLLARGLTIWGALCAFHLRRKGFVIMGSLTAMLPFSPVCILGVFAGGWMLVVLNDPEVRKHFT
jgi:hypothetical protein